MNDILINFLDNTDTFNDLIWFMVNLDIYTYIMLILSTYSITFALMNSPFFIKVRNFSKRFKNFEKLFECAHCTGFWSAGISIGLFLYQPFLVLMLSLAGACLLIHVCVDLIQTTANKIEGKYDVQED